jgi:hypothetical protein
MFNRNLALHLQGWTKKSVLTQLKSGIARVCHLLTEYRSASRRHYNVALTICWRDKRGKLVQAVARCVDISDFGVRIEYNQAVAKFSPIRICTNEGTLVKTGKVSYCRAAGSAYLIGVEFCKAVL